MLSSIVFYNNHYNIHQYHHHHRHHHRLTRDASCCTTAHLLLLHRPLPHSHADNSTDNNTDVPSVCRLLLPSLLNKPNLTTLSLDHGPFSCVVDSAWAQAGLPVPPPQVVEEGWADVLQHIRQVSCCCVSEARVCAES